MELIKIFDMAYVHSELGNAREKGCKIVVIEHDSHFQLHRTSKN
jgi:hypothetical protein